MLFTVCSLILYSTKKNQSITPKENAPAKKTIEVQKRFFSTKRKAQKKNLRLAKPTKEEKIKIMEKWKDNDESSCNVDFTSEPSSAESE